MKCLVLTSGRASRCVPLSKIEEVMIDYDGENNGNEYWVVCIRCAGSKTWYESYSDYAVAMKRFNELVAILEDNDNGEN